MTPGGPVRVEYRKFDGSLHWTHAAILLGEDEHGVWVGTPAGTLAYRGQGAGRVILPHAILFPTDAWWTASFKVPPSRAEVYCDVTTPPEWASTGEVSMVDLDLDVVRDRQGNTGIVDQDEFAEHQIRYGYPADVVDRAERAAEELLAAVSTRVEPFGATGPAWLARLLTG